MNKKQKIIALTLLAWLISANMTAFAAEALPDMSSPFDVPADSGSSGEELPALKKKADSSGEELPALKKKADSSSEELPALNKKEAVTTPLNDKKPDNKVVSASKTDAKNPDTTDKGSDVTSDGSKVISPKPKKMTKSGPEVAFLILPSLVLGYLYNKRKRK